MAKEYGLGRGLASLIPHNSLRIQKKNLAQKKNDDQKVGGRDEKNSTVGKKQDWMTDHSLDDVTTDVLSERKYLNDSVEKEEKDLQNVLQVDVNIITSNPHQPRIDFDEEKLAELVLSIKEHGILQPLVVTRTEEGYELIAGERRLQASKKAGLKHVPVIVRVATERQKAELALIENIQRHDLNVVEEAKAYSRLIKDYDISQEEVAKKVGKSRSSIANRIRLLGLPIEIQRALAEGKITEGHAKIILVFDNPEKQRALFDEIVTKKLTVREAENRTKVVLVEAHERAIKKVPELQEIEDLLTSKLRTKVKVSGKDKKKGKIVIDYYSEEELDVIIKIINHE